MRDFILQPPQRGKRRHGQEDATTGGQDPRNLSQGDCIIINVLQDVGGQHQIDRAIGQRQLTDIAQEDGTESLLLTRGNCSGTGIDSGDIGKAQLAQQAQVGPGAGADIQDARARRQVQVRERLGKQLAPTDKPPVVFLHGGLHSVYGLVHGSVYLSSWRSVCCRLSQHHRSSRWSS